MKLKNETYDILKWIVQILMPAVITLIGTVGLALSWVYTDLAMTMLGAFTVFLGSILGVSSYSYNKDGN